MGTACLLTDWGRVLHGTPLHRTPPFHGTLSKEPTFTEPPAKEDTPHAKDDTPATDRTPLITDPTSLPPGQTSISENITFPQLRLRVVTKVQLLQRQIQYFQVSVLGQPKQTYRQWLLWPEKYQKSVHNNYWTRKGCIFPSPFESATTEHDLVNCVILWV